MTLLLKASQIRKTFYFPTTIEILKGIDLSIQPGETIAIMGKSGEGKSTLLHILGTLEKPCQGALEICGQHITSHSLSQIRNRSLGFIFQQGHLLAEETVLTNVLMPARIARIPTHARSQAYARAMDLLGQVGLAERLHFPAKLLSGGEKQRVSIARALCNDPGLILADEPSGNLDSLHSRAIQELLLGLARQHRKGLVVVTHDLEFAQRCDRTLLLKDGILSD